jgi:hypothetical protein
MRLALAHWSARRLLKLWGAGLLLEAALLLPMFALLEAPEPPIVERLQGRVPGRGTTMVFRADTVQSAPAGPRSPSAAPWPVEEDSFYTVLHWPPHKPLLAGGGRVIAMPMRHWWMPALYMGAVPLSLLAASAAWVLARAQRRAGNARRP